MAEDARTRYMRDYRKTPAGQAQLDAQKKRDKARRAAVARLIHRHESEFEDLFREELRKVIGARD
jgi:hypothetical protein